MPSLDGRRHLARLIMVAQLLLRASILPSSRAQQVQAQSQALRELLIEMAEGVAQTEEAVAQVHQEIALQDEPVASGPVETPN